MAPRVMQGATKSTGGDRPNKKRPLSPEKNRTGLGSNASVAPSDEHPLKRQRSSTVGTKAADASAPATISAAEKSKSTEAQVVTNDESEGSSEDESEEEASKLSGPFDLYATYLPFLHKVYSPAGSDAVFPEKLYKEILTYQAKNDRTAKITIPERFASGNGIFRSGLLCDPMEEMPFDIAITDIEQVDKLKLESQYGRPDTDACDGPGLKAILELEEGGCGIASSSGNLSLRPLWKKVDKDGKVMELFEGKFTFKVTYSSLYSRKGHGKGQNETVAFWAVHGKA